MTARVVVRNASTEPLGDIPWTRAVLLVLSGQALITTADPTRTVRSQHLSMPMPRVITLVRYVYIAYDKLDYSRPTRAAVLERDHRRCIYCAGPGNTVEHILPRSRGGQNTWTNLAACCGPCNNRKGDRTPAEANMPLLYTPSQPPRALLASRRLAAALAATA